MSTPKKHKLSYSLPHDSHHLGHVTHSTQHMFPQFLLHWILSWEELSVDAFEVEHLEFAHCFLYLYLVNHSEPDSLMVSDVQMVKVVHFVD